MRAAQDVLADSFHCVLKQMETFGFAQWEVVPAILGKTKAVNLLALFPFSFLSCFHRLRLEVVFTVAFEHLSLSLNF